jgi:alpha-galactosidase
MLLLAYFAVAAVRAIDNGLAARPGLGWNSDYCTLCSHVDGAGRLRPGVSGFQNEAFIKHIADFLNASGLQALGYTNVNMDSLWDLPTRDAGGDLQPDPALWPSGFDAIIGYVHSRGLGFGVYGDRGTLDCNKNPGQLGHEAQDAAFFARHGIDWFKSDSVRVLGKRCPLPGAPPSRERAGFLLTPHFPSPRLARSATHRPTPPPPLPSTPRCATR